MSRVLFIVQPSQRRTRRGFSLVELLAVVTITALLAVAGIAMFRRYIVASRGSEATSFLQGLRAAEATYMAENHSYLNVSTGGTSASAFSDTWYPTLVPANTRSRWVNSQHPDWLNWQRLGLPLDKTVLFSYLANAGGAGTALPPLQVKNGPVFAVPQLDWYVLQAKGDTDGNGVYALYATTSFTGETYIENEGE